MPDSLTDQYWRLPPISRTLATCMLVCSIGVHFGMIPMQWIVYNKYYLLKFPPELWRLVTGFLLTGPQLSLLLDTYFFYNACRDMETGHPRMQRKADFAWYLVCICAFILLIDYFVAIMAFWTLTRGLIVALTYTSTQQQQGLQTTYIVIRIPAPLTPYVMIFSSLLFPGGVNDFFLGLYGLVAAHMWEFLTRVYPQLGGGPNILETPAFMVKLVELVERRIGSDAASGSRTGAESGPLPDSWKTRGSGRRLG